MQIQLDLVGKWVGQHQATTLPVGMSLYPGQRQVYAASNSIESTDANHLIYILVHKYICMLLCMHMCLGLTAKPLDQKEQKCQNLHQC